MLTGVPLRLSLALCVFGCAVMTAGKDARSAGLLLGAKVQTLPRPSGIWPVRTFTVSSRVWAFEQTQDGRLWLGGSQGLQTFDGKLFTSIEGSTEPRGEIRALQRTPDGTLYVGGIQGLWRLEKGGQRFAKLGTPGEGVLALLAKGNDVWVGTQKGLFFSDHDSLLLVPQTAAWAVSAIAIMAPATHAQGHELWLGTLTGILAWRNQALTQYWQGSEVHAIGKEGDGTLVAATENHGLIKLSPSAAAQTEDNWNGDPTVLSLANDRSGTLWAGQSSGLRREHKGVFSGALATKDLPAARVHGLFVDDAQNVWLALDGNAIAELRQDLEIRSYPSPYEELPFAVAKDARGGVWMTTGPALQKWTDESLVKVSPTSKKYWMFRPIQTEPDGSLWAADYMEALVHLTDKQGSYALEGWALDNGRQQGASALHVSADGAVWAGIDNGDVVERRGSSVTRYAASPDGCPGPVLRMLQPNPGQLLVATNGRGLCLLNTSTKQFERVGTPAENRISVTSLARLSDGEVWAGSVQNGVGRVRNKEIVWVGYDQGLRAELVGAILEDNKKNVWLAARSGIFRIPPGDLGAAADSASRIIEPLVFSTADGLLNSDCISGWAEPAVIDSQGRLWVLTLKGPLMMKHPESVAQPRWHPPRIVSMTVNGLPIHVENSGAIRAAAAQGNLEIHYSAVALSEGRRLRYRYILEGFDKSWVDAEDRAAAFYTNLAPGRYRFRLQASLHGLAAAVEMTPLHVNLVPPFHRTLPFYVLVAAVLVMAVASVMRVRANNRRRQHQLLATERRRISQDIHDSLEQTFVAMRFQVDAARRALPATEAAHEPLDRTMSLVNRAMKETRAAIWALRAEFPGKADLVTQVAVVAGEASQGQGMQVKVSSTGQPFAVPAEVQRQALQITREGLSNAMKHAQAGQVLVEISFTETAAVLKVQDNGQGFSVENSNSIPGHYGLSGMKERAEQIRSKLDINSQPGRGTSITLTIPRPTTTHQKPI